MYLNSTQYYNRFARSCQEISANSSRILQNIIGQKGDIEMRSNQYWQYDLLPDILAQDANRVGKYGFAVLSPQNYAPTGDIYPVNYLLSCGKLSETWFHCFVADQQFERLWHKYDKYLPWISQSAGFISTDFSLYRNQSHERQVWNCRRNRAITYALMRDCPNTPIIPTAGFAGEDSWEWCFDGLPSYSTVAISTNGVLSEPEARRLFIGGVDALIHTLHPTTLIICGHYPSWLNDKYPSTQILQIPSFSQLRQMRRCK